MYFINEFLNSTSYIFRELKIIRCMVCSQKLKNYLDLKESQDKHKKKHVSETAFVKKNVFFEVEYNFWSLKLSVLDFHCQTNHPKIR